MSLVYSLSECCLLWFRQAHQRCHLGHSSPHVGPERATGVYMVCLSTVLPVAPSSPIFSMISVHLRSLRAHPSIPTNPLDSNSLILVINLLGKGSLRWVLTATKMVSNSVIVCQTLFFLQVIKGFSHMTSCLSLMQF